MSKFHVGGESENDAENRDAHEEDLHAMHVCIVRASLLK